MRSPVLVICTSRKTQVKPPHACVQSSHSLHTATCPQTSHQQHPSIPRYWCLHRWTWSTTHSAGSGQRGHRAVPDRITPHSFSHHTKPLGPHQLQGSPADPCPAPWALSSLRPNHGPEHHKGRNLSRCWTLCAVCSSHYPRHPYTLVCP